MRVRFRCRRMAPRLGDGGKDQLPKPARQAGELSEVTPFIASIGVALAVILIAYASTK